MQDDAAFYAARGFGGPPASAGGPPWSWSTSNLGFTDPASPLGCDLDDVLAATRAAARRRARRPGVPVFFTTVVYDEAGGRPRRVFLRKVPALRDARGRARAGWRSTRGSAAGRPSR